MELINNKVQLNCILQLFLIIFFPLRAITQNNALTLCLWVNHTHPSTTQHDPGLLSSLIFVQQHRLCSIRAFRKDHSLSLRLNKKTPPRTTPLLVLGPQDTVSCPHNSGCACDLLLKHFPSKQYLKSCCGKDVHDWQDEGPVFLFFCFVF